MEKKRAMQEGVGVGVDADKPKRRAPVKYQPPKLGKKGKSDAPVRASPPAREEEQEEEVVDEQEEEKVEKEETLPVAIVPSKQKQTAAPVVTKKPPARAPTPPETEEVEEEQPIRTSAPKPRQRPAEGDGSIPAGLEPCQYCARTFNADRLSKHEGVCQLGPAGQAKQRKKFDMTKKRTAAIEDVE